MINTTTVNDAGFEVGINLGSSASISINGESISKVLGTKQDQETVRQYVFPEGTLYMTLNGMNPVGIITDTKWESLGTIQTSDGVTIYFWKRALDI